MFPVLCHQEHLGVVDFFLLSLACFPVGQQETMLCVGRNGAAEQQLQLGLSFLKCLGDQ